MNRNIKFRGLRVDGKGWVYGDLKRVNDNRFGGAWTYIWVDTEDIEDSGEEILVTHESVGQLHNGLSHKAKTEVFVGDKIMFDLEAGLGQPRSNRQIGVVRDIEFDYSYYTNISVVGNIHEENDVK